MGGEGRGDDGDTIRLMDVRKTDRQNRSPNHFHSQSLWPD